MPLTRRTLTLVLLLVAAGSLAFATGAAVINDDADTFAEDKIAVQPADGPNGRYAYLNDDDEIAIEFELTEINERRGVDDAGALIDFVEGTYVQGVIPGYEYTEPLDGLLSAARRQGDSGGGF